MREIASFLVVVQTISYDKVILYVETAIINIQTDLQAAGLYKERGNVDILGLLLAQNAQHLFHCGAGFNDVLHNDHGASAYILVQTDKLLYRTS